MDKLLVKRLPQLEFILDNAHMRNWKTDFC